MYGKHFPTMYTGSMYGSGPTVFAVWGYVISHTDLKTESVELNPAMLSNMIGTSEEEIEKAITKLCSVDPKSRTKDFDGARLKKIGEFQYGVVTFSKYQKLGSAESAKESKRKWWNEHKDEQNAARSALEVARSRSNGLEQITTTKTTTLTTKQQHQQPSPVGVLSGSGSSFSGNDADNGKTSTPNAVHMLQHTENDSGSLSLIVNSSEFQSCWNSLGSPFAKIEKFNEKRTKSLKLRSLDPYFLNHWKEAMEVMKSSKFHRGEDGDRGWIATVDWFLKPDSVVKLMERKSQVAEVISRCKYDFKAIYLRRMGLALRIQSPQILSNDLKLITEISEAYTDREFDGLLKAYAASIVPTGKPWCVQDIYRSHAFWRSKAFVNQEIEDENRIEKENTAQKQIDPNSEEALEASFGNDAMERAWGLK